MKEAIFHYKNVNAAAPNQSPTIGVAALIEWNQKLLLERRSDSKRWAIIGGSIKSNESLTEALFREVKEETGLQVAGYEIFGTFSHPSRIIEYPDGNVKRTITIAYRVNVQPFEQLVCSNESLELKFFAGTELDEVIIAETHTQIIEHYKNNSGMVYE
ncbi:MAG: rppH [Paenibacillus sp.]|nr:rppH [Paenibacillus sp.]